MTRVSELIALYEPQTTPFATHVPLLRASGAGIKTVLELGTGLFSTPLFLDRGYYPELEALVSVESDEEWARLARRGDARHAVVFVAEPIESYLAGIDLDRYDLIFVDNSTLAERRCDTLRYLSTHVGRSLVVAHDFEVPSYREAAAGFAHALIDDRQSPWTALLWRTHPCQN